MNRMLAQMAVPAVANARKEAAQLQAMIDAEKGGFKLDAADWAFYSREGAQGAVRVRRVAAQAVLRARPRAVRRRVLRGQQAVRPHVQGAPRPAGLRARACACSTCSTRTARSSRIFIGDYYARSNKNGGAWMSAYVSQDGLTGDKPVVANHLNIPKPPAGEPTLLTQDEVTTAFHEFGHALHGMFSHVKYPRFAGTQVPRDFVEYPSQFNEMWATLPRGAGELRQELQDRRADPAGAAGQGAGRGAGSTRASRRPNTWRPRCSTRPGTSWAPTRCRTPPTSRRSRRRRCTAWGWTSRRCRRAIAAPTSRTRSRAAIRRATTPTSGARCSRPTPPTGCSRTAA